MKKFLAWLLLMPIIMLLIWITGFGSTTFREKYIETIEKCFKEFEKEIRKIINE